MAPLLLIVNLVVPDEEAVKISWFSIWSNIAKALPVAPKDSGRVTSSWDIGVSVPIPILPAELILSLSFSEAPDPLVQKDKNPGYASSGILNPKIPDTRQVYLWEVVKPDKPENFDFYLSDLKGKVEISVEGVTKDNQLVKVSKLIEVQWIL